MVGEGEEFNRQGGEVKVVLAEQKGLGRGVKKCKAEE